MNVTVRPGENERVTISDLKRALPHLEKLAQEPPLGTTVIAEEGDKIEINPDKIEREIIFYTGILERYEVCDYASINSITRKRLPPTETYVVGRKIYSAQELETI